MNRVKKREVENNDYFRYLYRTTRVIDFHNKIPANLVLALRSYTQ